MSIENMHQRLVSGETIAFSCNGRDFEVQAVPEAEDWVGYRVIEGGKIVDSWGMEPDNSGPIDEWAKVIDERKG